MHGFRGRLRTLVLKFEGSEASELCPALTASLR
jgi:hypothetical protein